MTVPNDFKDFYCIVLKDKDGNTIDIDRDRFLAIFRKLSMIPYKGNYSNIMDFSHPERNSAEMVAKQMAMLNEDIFQIKNALAMVSFELDDLLKSPAVNNTVGT